MVWGDRRSPLRVSLGQNRGRYVPSDAVRFAVIAGLKRL